METIKTTMPKINSFRQSIIDGVIDNADDYLKAYCFDTFLKTIKTEVEALNDIYYAFKDGLMVVAAYSDTTSMFHRYHFVIIDSFDLIYYDSNVIDKTVFESLEHVIECYKNRMNYIERQLSKL